MRLSPMWMSIMPDSPTAVRMMLTEPQVGPVLKARLSGPPAQPRALAMLLEALAHWHQRPLRAVLDAEAPDVQRDPARWAEMLGDLRGPFLSVEWLGRPTRRRRDPFLDSVGDFTDARRHLTFAATGYGR